MTPWVRVLY